jgi:hypothetical protein
MLLMNKDHNILQKRYQRKQAYVWPELLLPIYRLFQQCNQMGLLFLLDPHY